IKSGNIPKNLRGKRILSLDLALVVAGTNFRGEFEARLKDIIKEASQNKDIILFIDEIHTIIGAGNTTGGLDAANILKPALSRGDIQCIGATTLAEYKKHLEKDPALDRRFQTLTLSEPTSDEAKRILTAAKASYERFHAIKLPTAVINLAVELSVRYIPDRFLPDKAFDIIDEASALAKHSEIDQTLTKAIATLERNLRQAQKQKDTFIKEENYDEAAKWHTKEKALLKKIATEKENEELESAVTIPVVTEEHILATVSRMANIPFTKLAKEQPKEKLERLKRTLDKQLIGQSEASKAIQETLLRSLSQIGDPNRPLGSFLFLGPTGVGKTLIGKILATEFFGDRSALIRLDMSEFMERHSVAQIIGAPAGYVGYGEGGKLTEQVRRRPYSVVLFDEIEKAHPDVFNVLLQILDEGFLTDAEGRKVSFRNTLVLLTSNIGTAAFTQSARIGFSKSEKKSSTDQFETTKREVLADLKKELKPELLARLDQIIVFNALSPEAIESITKLEIASLAKRLKGTNVRLTCPMTVARFIAKKSFAPEQGARLVRKNVQDILEHAVAEKIINAPETKSVRLALKNNQVVCL
ncbi:MAG: ATP-dependent Clp protease ATP-binding subunit, partial [Patescibacteria group bacterium]